jgi:hypothetical protein
MGWVARPGLGGRRTPASILFMRRDLLHVDDIAVIRQDVLVKPEFFKSLSSVFHQSHTLPT